MADQCVVAVFSDLTEAQAAQAELVEAGHPTGQITLAVHRLPHDTTAWRMLDLPDDSLADAADVGQSGAAIGAAVGLAASLASGLGSALLVGPLGGALVGGITGGLVGAMAGWGVHQRHAARYEALLAEGRVLLVAVGDPLKLASAYRRLADRGPLEVHTFARTDDEAC